MSNLPKMQFPFIHTTDVIPNLLEKEIMYVRKLNKTGRKNNMKKNPSFVCAT